MKFSLPKGLLLCAICVWLAIPLSLSADSYRDSLLGVIRSDRQEIQRLHAKVLLAADLMPQFMDSAALLLDESRYLAGEKENIHAWAAWMNIRANHYWYSGQRDSAMMQFKAVFQHQDPQILNRRAAASVNLGALYNIKGMRDSALFFLSHAREMFSELGDEAGLSRVDYSLGIQYAQRDNYEMALRHYLRSLEYQEREKDTFALVYSYNTIGNIFLKQRNAEKALEFYNRALALDMAFDRLNHRSSIYNNISSVYLDYLGDIDKAEEFALLGIGESESVNYNSVLFYLYSNLGSVNLMRGNFREALRYNLLAAETSDQLVPFTARAMGHVNRGKIFIGLGNYDSARHHLTRGINMAREADAFEHLKRGYEQLFLLDSTLGNYQAAIGHLQQAARMHDTIWQKERADRLAELQAVYELDRKEAENHMLRTTNELNQKVIHNQRRLVLLGFSASFFFVLFVISLWVSRRRINRKKEELSRMNAEIIRQNEQITRQNSEITKKSDEIQQINIALDQRARELEALNQTKDRFFSIISHDLRGPFNSLMGFLEMLVDNFHSLNEQERFEIISGLQKTSRNTYNLVVNLLEWSTVNMGKIKNRPEPTRLNQVVRESVDFLAYNLVSKQHVFSNETDAELYLQVDPRLLRAILINLINNAIKFTPQGGHIRVSSRVLGKFAEVCIEDNGIGIPQDKIGSLFRIDAHFNRSGTEDELGTGLGLIMVKEYLQLMGGSILVESEEERGSRFCFQLPLEAIEDTTSTEFLV